MEILSYAFLHVLREEQHVCTLHRTVWKVVQIFGTVATNVSNLILKPVGAFVPFYFAFERNMCEYRTHYAHTYFAMH